MTDRREIARALRLRTRARTYVLLLGSVLLVLAVGLAIPYLVAEPEKPTPRESESTVPATRPAPETPETLPPFRDRTEDDDEDEERDGAFTPSTLPPFRGAEQPGDT